MDTAEPIIRELVDTIIRWLTAPVDVWIVLLIVVLVGLLIGYSARRDRNRINRRVDDLLREIARIEREKPKPSRWRFD